MGTAVHKDGQIITRGLWARKAQIVRPPAINIATGSNKTHSTALQAEQRTSVGTRSYSLKDSHTDLQALSVSIAQHKQGIRSM